MIVKENLEISGRAFVKQYSDSGFYIERDGVQYSEAIDPSEFGRTYTETDIPIDGKPSPIDEETEQKAEAYDYLTGRNESEVESNE